MRPTTICILVAMAGACGTTEPPLSDATTLQCPMPGSSLPFRLPSHGYQNADNTTIAANDPRIKDEASDSIGNPGGESVNIYFTEDQAPVTTPIDYHGVKARTTPTGGLVSTPLAGENVSLWHYGNDTSAWTMLGRTTTGSDGDYDLPATGFVADNADPVYAVLEADGTCAEHFDYLYPPGEKVVVFDIDGTLTTDNNQIVMELTDESYVPALMTAGNTLVQTWAMKGYPVIYLTARVHTYRTETRSWLDAFDFPPGPVITENGAEEASAYKTAWLKRMVDDFGWVPVAAYGNEDTDITAYGNVDIPLAQTFIVGPSGGDGGTVAIPNMDFTQHIATYVDAQPNNH